MGDKRIAVCIYKCFFRVACHIVECWCIQAEYMSAGEKNAQIGIVIRQELERLNLQ